MITCVRVDFKKGCYGKNAIAAFGEMFMNTLSKVLCVYSTAVITAPFTNSTLCLTNIIQSTRTASQGVYEIACITCEVVAYLERFTEAMKSD